MTKTLSLSSCGRLIVAFSFVLVVFLATASSVFACGMSCNGTYHPAGSPGAVSQTGRYDTGVCNGSIDVSECPSGPMTDPGGGGGGGGGSVTDLTASNTNPSIATQGQSATYSVTVYNGGVSAASTATSFQIATDSTGSDSQVVGTVTTNPLQPYASRSVSLSYTHAGNSFYMRACADWFNGVFESNEANNCGSWSLVTVSVPAVIDLTAGSASAPGASRGNSSTVSALIQNIGGATAGASNAYYQLVAPNSKSNTSGVVGISSLAASASATASFLYNFATSGNYQVRFCADWYGAVAEGDESNNCGPWSDIFIIDPPVSSSVSCQVSSTAVTAGQSVTYTAYGVGAATSPYTWTPADGVGSYGSGSTATRAFTDADVGRSFAMQVAATYATAPAQCPVVTVSAGICSGTATATLTATPSRVRTGTPTTLSWNASAINTSCTITGTDGFTQTTTAASCAVPTTVVTRTIATQSTYSISCDGGPVLDSITVNVIPNFQEF